MGLILVVGKYANAVQRMGTAPVFSPAADANFPGSMQGNAVPSKFSRFGSVAADGTATYDLNEVQNADFETASPPLDKWTNCSVGASNTPSRTVAGGEFVGGVAGLKLLSTTIAGGNLTGVYQDVYVKAGTYIHVGANIRGDGTRSARLRAQLLETGQYLGASAWSSSPTDIATRATNTFLWVETTGAGVLVPAVPDRMPELDLLTLRVTAWLDAGSGAAGTAFVDGVSVHQSNNIFALIGHRYLTPRVSLDLRRSTDNFSGSDTLEANLTSFPQTFYKVLGALRHERYWRLKVVGTPQAAPVFGETLIAQSLTPAGGFEWQFEQVSVEPQVRGTIRSLLLSDRPLRALKLKFNYASAAAFNEARDIIYGASRAGAFPLLVIPMSGEPDAIYGRIQPQFGTKRYWDASWRDSEFSVMELPLPTLYNL